MKKTYRLENLACANCAEKMEAGINELTEVNEAKVIYMGQKLIIDADDHDAVLPKAQKVISKYERKCKIATP